jgi:flagellar motility protein MotE (MotC chaperone)
MPPESAAKVMEGLQSDYALEILAQMDPKKSSKILAALVQNKPEKAAELTKKLESR